jgi:heat shock protein HslJ
MRKRAGRAIACTVVTGFIVLGCSAVPAALPGRTLEGTSWRAVSIDTVTTMVSNAPTLTFATGRLRGSGGCNTYSGTFSLQDGALDIDGLRATLKQCETSTSEMERQFMRALVSATTVAFEGDEGLVLDGTGGTVRFTLRS